MPDPLDQLPPKPAPAAAPPAPVDDAGAQALTEALGSSFKLVKWLLALLVGAFLITGRFTVESNQVALILRFGKPVGEGEAQLLKPGWHWKFPPPIDEIVTIPVGESHMAASTTGWFATTPELEAAGKEPPARGSLQPGAALSPASTGLPTMVVIRRSASISRFVTRLISSRLTFSISAFRLST